MRYLGDDTTSQTVDLYNQQLTQFKLSLADILPQISKNKADVDADVFRLSTVTIYLNTLLNQWKSGILTSTLTDQYASQLMDNIIAMFPTLASDYQGTILTDYVGSIAGLNNFISKYSNVQNLISPDSIPVILSKSPAGLMSAMQAVAAAQKASTTDANLQAQLEQANQNLKSAITGWLQSAQGNVPPGTMVPTYQDLVNEVENASHPIAQTAVIQMPTAIPATPNYLLYAGAALLALMFFRRS